MNDESLAGPKPSGSPDLVPLATDSLVHACERESLDFADTAELQPQEKPLGQDRVLEAIEFGTGITRSGYNLYVMGSPAWVGTHLLTHALSARAGTQPVPSDWCHVADFDKPDRPHALALPAGQGVRLRDDMRRLVEDLLTALPAAFQSDEYRSRLQEIQDAFKQREDDVAADIGHRAAEQDIVLLSTPTGYTLAPSKKGKVLSQSDFDALDDDVKERLEQEMDALRRSCVPHWAMCRCGSVSCDSGYANSMRRSPS